MSSPIINTGLYPLDKLTSAEGLAWIAEVRTSLEQDGSCTLPDFVDAETLAEMAAQANSITHLAYAGPIEVSPYFFNYRLGEGEVLPDDHPLKRKGKRNLAQRTRSAKPAAGWHPFTVPGTLLDAPGDTSHRSAATAAGYPRLFNHRI